MEIEQVNCTRCRDLHDEVDEYGDLRDLCVGTDDREIVMIGLTTHFRLDHNRVACGDVNGVYGCHGNPRETTCKRCLRTLAHREAVAYATDMANRGGSMKIINAEQSGDWSAVTTDKVRVASVFHGGVSNDWCAIYVVTATRACGTIYCGSRDEAARVACDLLGKLGK